MKVLITGSRGQLGSELTLSVPPGVELTCMDVDRLDITNRNTVASFVRGCAPDLLINAAAYTSVDKAESEPDAAYAVNASGAENLALAAASTGARFIQISTDFVFDGAKSSPYMPSDMPAPLGVYGASKLEGERQAMAHTGGRALIVRTAWLYSAHGNNFVKTMLRLMRERERIGVVADQVGTPTWARTLAEALWAAAGKPDLRGIYHWTDAGVAGWYDLAVAVREEGLRLGLLGKAAHVHPIRTEDYPAPARRPAYSVLDKTSAWRDLGIEPLHWRVALRRMMEELRHA